MTVSRIINRSGYTSNAARLRVDRAIAELGYVPNAIARQLRSKRTRTIALVVSDITNPFFTVIASGVEDAAGLRDHAVIFVNTDESQSVQIDYLRVLMARQVDGVLLVPADNSAEPFRLLRSQKIPVVVLDRRVRVRQVDEVRCDSVAGAVSLVGHLIGLGHRRIAVITGRHASATSVDRAAGYERALIDAGITPDPELIRYDSFSLAGGYRRMQEILAITPRPTAVFAANNFIAFGAPQALREAGLRVPEDRSLVTFDDLPEGWQAEPFLTVLAQRAYDIGRQAAELLLERLEGTAQPERRVIILPGELIVLRSSGPLRALESGPGERSSLLKDGPA